MAHQVLSATLNGIDAQLIRVQIDSAPGLHSFTVVGLPDKAVQESVERVGAAIRQCGMVPPASKNRRFIVNLAPADIRKEGSGLDLAIAVAYLLETGQIQVREPDSLFLGELGLQGALAHTDGILAAAMLADQEGIPALVIPAENAQEAAVVGGTRAFGAPDLASVIAHLDGTRPLLAAHADDVAPPAYGDDSFSHIKGQTAAKRALVVAAAGGHNILMSGAPGSGKTLLARAVSGILPPLTLPEALEVAKIHSSCGLLHGSVRSIPRPFCSPHHTASSAAIVGGGSTIRPGQVSLAHRGVLFLDEFPEFARNVLEALRQPLEDGVVSVSRASGTITLPAKFMLVAAMNPCPCGNLGDPAATCICAPGAVIRYSKRVSGPLLDRLDVQVQVMREGVQMTGGEDISLVRGIIAESRGRQRARLEPLGLVTNSDMTHKNIDALCALEPAAERLLADIVNRSRQSMRSYHRVKKVARTIADLEGVERVSERHIAEALALRIRDLHDVARTA